MSVILKVIPPSVEDDTVFDPIFNALKENGLIQNLEGEKTSKRH